MWERSVEYTPEVYRIHAIPRRVWSDRDAADLSHWLTQHLRQPMGDMSLRPIQAIALWELHRCRGLFGVMRVGSGKTLVSLLAPVVTNVKRPLLLIPAKLRTKTRKDLLALSAHWQVPKHIRIESYELLGRMQANDMLDKYRPDLIVCDEVHKLRNRKAAVTRRVARFMREYPATMFVAMSGTITKNSLRDYSRLLRWALKAHMAPIPQQESELDDWADALDENVNMLRRVKPGALMSFARTRSYDDYATARQAYYERLTQTAGVVATTSTPIDCTLTIEVIEPDMQRQTDDAFNHLRTNWETPDAWPIADVLSLNRHARELALGFYYRWNPRPPDAWYYARKQWARDCRAILSTSRTWDSEGQLAQAVIAGIVQCPSYHDWIRVKPTFEPRTECVWLDYTVLQTAIAWARTPGIIWCGHVAFAEALAMASGMTYYGRGGVASNGRAIEQADSCYACIASIQSNTEGRNLQSLYARNLVIHAPANGPQWEQLIGRTHREGQLADEVTVDVIMSCIEHYGSFERAKEQARYVQQTQGQAQKLLEAQILMPSIDEIVQREGPRWHH